MQVEAALRRPRLAMNEKWNKVPQFSALPLGAVQLTVLPARTLALQSFEASPSSSLKVRSVIVVKPSHDRRLVDVGSKMESIQRLND